MSALVRSIGASIQKTPRHGQNDPTPIDDAGLVARVREGDTWAEDILVKRHLRQVTRVVARILGSRQDADDVVQDAFLAAFEQLPTLKEPGAFRGWLMRIAINRTRKLIRRQKLLRLVGLDRSQPDATLEFLASFHVRPNVRDELAALDEVLGRMPTEQRIAWMLRYVEGHTVRDVSRLCCSSISTTKRRIATAHKKVLAAVDPEVLSHAW